MYNPSFLLDFLLLLSKEKVGWIKPYFQKGENMFNRSDLKTLIECFLYVKVQAG
jgi:hypothetical protein